MKLQKAKRRCLESGRIVLISGPDGDWLSNGMVAWEASNMGLTKDNVRAIMDISEKKIGDNDIIKLEWTDRSWWTAYHESRYDRPLKNRGMVMVDGIDYIVLTEEQNDKAKPYYIRYDDIKPIISTDKPIEYWVRKSNETDREMVAACYDLFVAAIITPEQRYREETEHKYGADRIEERIRELHNLIGER